MPGPDCSESRAASSGSTAGSSPSRAGPARLPRPRLLGTFEPALLGWSSREAILGDHDHLVVGGGLFRPIVLARGRAVGTWRLAAERVELQPFEPLPGTLAAALQADARALVRFLAG
jgi:DNA glycosylase AlkZ-like